MCICIYTGMYLYIYMYVCIYVYINIYIYMYICTYVYVCMEIYIYLCMYLYVCIYVNLHKSMCLYACASIQAFRFHISLSILDIYIFTPSHLEGACVYTKPFQGIALQHSSNTAGAEMFAADAAFKKHTAVHQCSAIKGA